MQQGALRLGWIGLGNIGLPMMLRLVRTEHSVIAFDIDTARLAFASGATHARSPAQVVQASEIVFLNLPDGDAVADVMFGADGCAAAGMNGKLVIDTSSIDPVLTQQLAQRVAQQGGRWVDAPVSGGVQAAGEGTLVALVGGADADVAAARPLVATFASRQTHLGPVGSGQWGKLANQAIVCGTIALWSEALTLAKEGGVDPAGLVEALAGAGADSRVRAAFAPLIAAGAFAPSRNLTKDIAMVIERADNGKNEPALFKETARVLSELRKPS